MHHIPQFVLNPVFISLGHFVLKGKYNPSRKRTSFYLTNQFTASEHFSVIYACSDKLQQV